MIKNGRQGTEEGRGKKGAAPLSFVLGTEEPRLGVCKGSASVVQERISQGLLSAILNLGVRTYGSISAQQGFPPDH
jgi:hypothetical protein